MRRWLARNPENRVSPKLIRFFVSMLRIRVMLIFADADCASLLIAGDDLCPCLICLRIDLVDASKCGYSIKHR